jgi:hypothetical protein
MSLTKLGPDASWFKRQMKIQGRWAIVSGVAIAAIAFFACDLLECVGVVDVFGCPKCPQAPN